MWRKFLKWSGILYVFCFLITAAHFPLTMKYAAKNFPLFLLFMPAKAPGIIRAYAGLFSSGVWPYGDRPDVKRMDDLLATDPNVAESDPMGFHGSADFIADRSNEYRLSPEHYAHVFGEFPVPAGGFHLTIGRTFCLMDLKQGIISKMFGPSNCYELVPRGQGLYEWRGLGGTPSITVKYRRKP